MSARRLSALYHRLYFIKAVSSSLLHKPGLKIHISNYIRIAQLDQKQVTPPAKSQVQYLLHHLPILAELSRQLTGISKTPLTVSVDNVKQSFQSFRTLLE